MAQAPQGGADQVTELQGEATVGSIIHAGGLAVGTAATKTIIGQHVCVVYTVHSANQ